MLFCVYKVSLGVLVNHWEISLKVILVLWNTSAAPQFQNTTPFEKIENVKWKE